MDPDAAWHAAKSAIEGAEKNSGERTDGESLAPGTFSPPGQALQDDPLFVFWRRQAGRRSQRPTRALLRSQGRRARRVSEHHRLRRAMAPSRTAPRACRGRADRRRDRKARAHGGRRQLADHRDSIGSLEALWRPRATVEAGRGGRNDRRCVAAMRRRTREKVARDDAVHGRAGDVLGEDARRADFHQLCEARAHAEQPRTTRPSPRYSAARSSCSSTTARWRRFVPIRDTASPRGELEGARAFYA